MVNRVFYVALGAATGVLVVRQLARAASALTPTSVAGSLVQSIRDFAADVAEAMAEREDEIRSALGLDEAEGSEYPDESGGGELPAGTRSAAGLVEFDPEQTMRLVPGARRP